MATALLTAFVLGVLGGSAVAGVGTTLSPAPWLFWLSIASPLFLRAWTRDRLEGVAFLVQVASGDSAAITGSQDTLRSRVDSLTSDG